MKSLDFDPAKPYYGGVSGLEFDLLPDYSLAGGFKWGWDVGHWDFTRVRNHGKFSNYLTALLNWSKSNPNHRVITVMLELKKVDGYLSTKFPSWYRAALPVKLDEYIAKYFDVNRIYKPGDLMAGGSDLVAAAQASGWPTLEELKGKFIFVLHGQMENSDNGPAQHYSDSPADRLCFESFSGGQPDPSTGNKVFWRMSTVGGNDDWPTKPIWAATQPGFITRGWPQSNQPWEAEDKYDDELHYARAMAFGVNVIATNQSSGSEWTAIGTEPFWPIMKKQWERDTHLPQAVCTNGPSAVVYRGVIHVFMHSKGDLKYHTMNSAGALSSAMSAPAQCYGDVRAAVYRDMIWITHIGKGGSNLYVMSFDGNSFSPEKIGTANDTPGIAVFQNKLYIVYPRKGDKKIVYRTYDGSSWSGEMLAGEHGYSCHYGPALCVFDNRLQILLKGETNNDLYLYAFDGSDWSRATNISDLNGANIRKAPAAIVNGDEMLVVFRGGSDRMWNISVKAGGQISGQRAVTVGRTEKSVSLVKHGGEILMFHRGSTSGETLWVTYLDADYK